MTTPPEGEPSNLDWVTSLRADSEVAWAAIRQQVQRSLVVYLRRNRPAGIAEIAGTRLDVVSDGGFIEALTAIEVTRVDGNRIVVRQRHAA